MEKLSYQKKIKFEILQKIYKVRNCCEGYEKEEIKQRGVIMFMCIEFSVFLLFSQCFIVEYMNFVLFYSYIFSFKFIKSYYLIFCIFILNGFEFYCFIGIYFKCDWGDRKVQGEIGQRKCMIRIFYR